MEIKQPSSHKEIMQIEGNVEEGKESTTKKNKRLASNGFNYNPSMCSNMKMYMVNGDHFLGCLLNMCHVWNTRNHQMQLGKCNPNPSMCPNKRLHKWWMVIIFLHEKLWNHQMQSKILLCAQARDCINGEWWSSSWLPS